MKEWRLNQKVIPENVEKSRKRKLNHLKECRQDQRNSSEINQLISIRLKFLNIMLNSTHIDRLSYFFSLNAFIVSLSLFFYFAVPLFSSFCSSSSSSSYLISSSYGFCFGAVIGSDNWPLLLSFSSLFRYPVDPPFCAPPGTASFAALRPKTKLKISRHVFRSSTTTSLNTLSKSSGFSWNRISQLAFERILAGISVYF